MLTLNLLRKRLAPLGRLGDLMKKSAAVAVAMIAVFVVYGNWGDIVDYFRDPTTGTIYIDSPEIYTRERLVNDRFVQDAWLRGELEKVNAWQPSPQTALLERERLSLGATDLPAEELAKLEAALKDRTLAISPSSEFRIRNALRELIRQEIVENQLDDRHDLDGNTIFMLKFDVAVAPGSRTSSSAVIDVTFRPRDNFTEFVDAPASDGLELHIKSYYTGGGRGSPFHRSMIESFTNWTDELNSEINDKVGSLNRQFWETTVLDAVIANFVNGSRPEFAPAAHGGGADQPPVTQTPESVAVWKQSAVADEAARLSRYFAMFALKKTIESTIDRQLDDSQFHQPNSTGPLKFAADWPLNAEITPSSVRKLPPAAFVSNRELAIGLATQPCIVKYEDIARKVAKQKTLPLLGSIFTQAGVINHQELLYSFGAIITEGQNEASAWRDVTRNRTRIEQVARLFAGPPKDSRDDRVAGTGRDTGVAAADAPPLASHYMSKLLSMYFEKLEAMPAQNDIDRSKTLGGFYEELQKEFPPDDTCKLDIFFYPVSYFAFLDELFKQRPFSYAVLPKYDAEIDSIETASLRQADLSGLMSGISGGTIPAKVGLDAMKAYGGKQLRTRVSLLGYGSSGAGNTPRFGWVLSPGLQVESGKTSLYFEPLQKSLSALISIPAWWERATVEIRTGWMNRESQTISWDSCTPVPPTTAPKANNPQVPAAQPAPGNACEYIVKLPQDPALLDDIVLKQGVRKPRIDKSKFNGLTIDRCLPATIEIPGDRLWRSTVVTLRGQRADSIVVLPDMKGILAVFDKVKSRVGGTELTVWTSEGSDTIADNVHIADPNTFDENCERIKVGQQ
jgi:hypothetical protein